MTRCPWAIKYGTKLATRCQKEASHLPADPAHEGRGLSQFPFQTVEWFAGDRREYRTERSDDHSWEE